MEMTITRGLRELKLLDKRIRDVIASAKFVSHKKKSSDKVEKVYTLDEFNKQAKAEFQKIQDLIERRKRIKSAIVKANAETIVKIGDKEYTIAEAIERKNSILYEKMLLSQLQRQYNEVLSNLSYKNEDVQERLDNLLEALVGRDVKVKEVAKETNEMAKKFLEENEWEIVNPLNIEKLIEQLRKDIDEFEAEVDYVLSEINSITKITIED